MNDGKVDWTGNFPAVITPFANGGEIDEARFLENIELLVSEGADGVIVSGSNGESWALEPGERLRLFGIAADLMKGRVPVIAGTGGIITGRVAELTVAAKEAGADGAMIMPPYYAMVNRKEVVAHYRAVSDASRLPIMLYNTPAATGVDLTADLCAELADIDYVVAVKQSVPDFVAFADTVDAVGDRIRVFTGSSGKRGLAAVAVGCVGFVSSEEPHLMGEEGIALWRISASGQIHEARRLQARILKLKNALGPIGTAPAAMKTAMNILGRPGGHVRRPLLDLDDAETERVRAALGDLGLLLGAKAAAE